MAVDEAILEAVGQDKVPPTLRLYAWNPACLSLGFAQPVKDADRARLDQQGWDLVRRPTGGRAILHADELTYAIIAPLEAPVWSGGVMASYLRISGVLQYALERLGMSARADQEYELPEDTSRGGAVCFEVPSNYEITVRGKKLIGSAQARRKEGVLQHGSLPLSGDLTRITRALAYPDEAARQEAARRLLAHAANAEMLGCRLTWEDCASAFVEAFSTMLGITFTDQPLTPGELQRAEALVAEKYANPRWTNRL